MDKSGRNIAALEAVPLDTQFVPESLLNIEEKVRSNLFPWEGQFSPQLISTLLEAFASPSDFVADPFMGSGTVLVEAGRRGLRAFGADINPAPFKMACVYLFINVGKARRREILDRTEAQLDSEIPSTLFSSQRNGASSGDKLKATLVALALKQDCAYARSLLESLIVLLDFYKDGLVEDKIFGCWHKLKRRVLELPFSRARIEAANCDARNLPLTDDSVDLVITSPPYVNVFNYHQKYRASLEALGWDLLYVAKSEIGSNRKHRGNRFLTVIQYCLDITAALLELRRVCKRQARIIVIVGRESNVRKTPFYNGDIVTRLATRCAGLTAPMRQERVFTNRYGISIYEDILHFEAANGGFGIPPAEVAIEALQSARKEAPNESLADLEDAIERACDVQPSLMYTQETGSA